MGDKENIADDNIKNKKLKSSEEFLSGLLQTDKIMPIITIVINFSGKLWNAPTALKQMFHNFDEKLLKFVKDYEINLIDPVAIGKENFNKFMTELREVLLCLKYSKDKEKLYNTVKNDKAFEHVPNEAVSLINTLTGSNMKLSKDKEESNMCEAIEGLIKDGEKKGRIGALFELIKDGIITLKEAAKRMKMSEKTFKKQLSDYGYVL